MPTKKISREQLRDALALIGMKQEELAEAAHVSPAAIAEFERGERVLHERTFQRWRRQDAVSTQNQAPHRKLVVQKSALGKAMAPQ